METSEKQVFRCFSDLPLTMGSGHYEWFTPFEDFQSQSSPDEVFEEWRLSKDLEPKQKEEPKETLQPVQNRFAALGEQAQQAQAAPPPRKKKPER